MIGKKFLDFASSFTVSFKHPQFETDSSSFKENVIMLPQVMYLVQVNDPMLLSHLCDS